MKNEVVLKVENFGVSFLQYTQGLDRQSLNVITDLDLELHAGEILAVVGSSGFGKSLLAHGILGIFSENAETSGTIYYRGHPLTQTDKETLRGNKIALIPQSVNYLDPLERVGRQIGISLVGVENEKERRRIVCALMEKYGLGSETYDLYPHQLSGGMARRVLLCTALASDCEIIIADEPTPGLDEASLQEVLCDFRRVADSGKAVLMITHDIHAACAIADRLAIFYAGSTLEIAGVQEMRGAGDVIGTAQSGLPRFRIADLERQAGLMAVARKDAQAFLERDPTMESERGRAVRLLLWLMEQDRAIRLISAG